MTPPLNDQASANTVPFEPVGASERMSDLRKLDTIREILVGDQLQSLGNRFHNLEKSQEAAYSRIGNELTTKFEALKVLNKSEIDNLGQSVAEMVAELRKDDTSIREELKEGRQQLADVEKRLDQINNDLGEQVRTMKDEFSKQLSELSQLLTKQQEEAARQAVSRQDFAKILSGLAGSLAPDGSPASSAD